MARKVQIGKVVRFCSLLSAKMISYKEIDHIYFLSTRASEKSDVFVCKEIPEKPIENHGNNTICGIRNCRILGIHRIAEIYKQSVEMKDKDPTANQAIALADEDLRARTVAHKIEVYLRKNGYKLKGLEFLGKSGRKYVRGVCEPIRNHHSHKVSMPLRSVSSRTIAESLRKFNKAHDIQDFQDNH